MKGKRQEEAPAEYHSTSKTHPFRVRFLISKPTHESRLRTLRPPNRVINRFIPAGAGNGTQSRPLLTQYTVHPRRCGEQFHIFKIFICMIGSSPQVRGTDQVCPGADELPRFIPAGAGNRFWTSRSVSARAVHPRRCGEQTIFISSVNLKNGSSPQVRGTGAALQLAI